MKHPSKYKFGSAEWQTAMSLNILSKLSKGKSLDDYDRAFITIQEEHEKREKMKYHKKMRKVV